MKPLRPSGDLLRAGAVEIGIQGNCAAVQGRRHGHHLKSRPRLITIGNATIAPLFQLRPMKSLLIGFLAIQKSLGVRRLQLVFQFHFLQFIGSLGIGYLQIIVGVVAAKGCHSQYLAGVDIHHHTECAVLYIISGNGQLHLLF